VRHVVGDKVKSQLRASYLVALSIGTPLAAIVREIS
jgi:hypothetical protein